MSRTRPGRGRAAGVLSLILSSMVFSQDEPFRLRIDVDVVTVDVGVFDANGRPVATLTRDDFQVYEDSELREIKSFDSVDTPYNVLSLLDCTVSVRDAWPILTQAFSTFVNRMRPQDRVAVAYFGSTTKTVMDWTPRNAGVTSTLYSSSNDASFRF